VTVVRVLRRAGVDFLVVVLRPPVVRPVDLRVLLVLRVVLRRVAVLVPPPLLLVVAISTPISVSLK
jgi:hypothetical protein